MNYKEKYENALERARELKNKLEKSCSLATPTGIESIFPELKESEDERIRKAIHIYLDWLDGRKDIEPRGEYSIRDMIAWLEKQCEPNWVHHKVDLSDCSEEYRKAYYDGWNNCNKQHSQLKGEQKPAWSEEDELMLKDTIMAIDMILTSTFQENNPNLYKSFEVAKHWLKSIKPQPHWKPTEEQMNELEKLIVWADELYDENSIRTIESLYNDLKKTLSYENNIK